MRDGKETKVGLSLFTVDTWVLFVCLVLKKEKKSTKQLFIFFLNRLNNAGGNMFFVFVQLSQGKAAFNWPQESLITWKGRSDQAVLQAQGKEKPHTGPSCAGNWEFETVPSRSLEPGAQKERQTLA